MTRWVGVLVLAGCGAHQTGAHHAEERAPEVVLPVVERSTPAEPASWNTSRVNGAGFRNRPREVARVALAGPIEALLTDGTRVFASAGGVIQMVRSEKIVWSQALRTRSLTLLDDGLWLSRDVEAVRLDVGTGAISVRTEAGGELASGVQPLGEAGRAWQTREGTLHTSAGWFLALGPVLDAAGKPTGSRSGLTSAGPGIATDAGVVYATSLDGVLLAADEKGEHWRAALPGPPVGPPVLGNGLVAVAVAAQDGEAGGVVVVDRSGAPRWRVRAASPALAPAFGPTGDGGWTLYVANRTGDLQALDAATGRPRWDVGFAGAITAMTVQDDVVLVASADGSLSAVEVADGGVRWHAQLGVISAPPLVAGSRAWVGLADGSLVALEE